jgi:hypothetical protein
MAIRIYTQKVTIYPYHANTTGMHPSYPKKNSTSAIPGQNCAMR